MTAETYLGKACRHSHINGQGLTERFVSSQGCVQCKRIRDRTHTKEYRKANAEAYRKYQHDYHAKLRAETPEVLMAYRQTQVDRGHTPVKQGMPVPKVREGKTIFTIAVRRSKLNYSQIMDVTHKAIAQMLFLDMRSKHINADGTLNDAGKVFGTTEALDEELMQRARAIVNRAASPQP